MIKKMYLKISFFTIRCLLIALLIFQSCKNKEHEKKDLKKNETAAETNTLSNEALLDTVQKQTLKYFWDFAEPNSLMARERYIPSGHYKYDDANIVTTGGSGFGLMALIVGIERGFIPRKEAIQRLDHIAGFLKKADRYHGAWSHWINGETGKTKPFGNKKDDGGDLVETSFLAQGFLVVREYLKAGSAKEREVAKKYDALWRGIDWNWYTNGKNVLYWHWSPNYDWQMDFPLEGYNEALITYVMAASSPEHAIDAKVYHEGWAQNGDIKSEKKAYGIPLILDYKSGDKGGPLFWAHYSYLGLDPKGLSDEYANYWELNKNQVKIDYLYCVKNPKGYTGYGKDSWGLTASYTRNDDDSVGYNAHMPGNDNGVIAPTAAVSSIPYTPEESLRAIRHFHQDLHELTWGPAGFYDAFSQEGSDWNVKKYLAIDQGPQIVMIENYRTGLIWKLFMQAPEIQRGLDKLGFTYSQ